MKQPRVRFPASSVPLALLALCIISYGILLSKMGVHFDDWWLVWVSHFRGPIEFKEAFLVDRPLLGWVYVLTNSLLGENPLVWQLFGVFVRWLSCAGFWWVLHGLWPERNLETTGAAFLFAVYPGFISIHIPFTRSHHILIWALTLSSMGAMVWAIRNAKWFWVLYPAAIVTSALALFSMEYYFGIELMRPVFIWIVLGEQTLRISKRLKKLRAYYLPFGLVLLSFLTWRLTTPTPRGQITLTEKLIANPIAGLLQIIQTVFQDLYKASFLAWGQVFSLHNLLSSYDLAVIVRYIVIIIAAAVLVLFFMTGLEKQRQASKDPTRRKWAFLMILLGILALFLGGIPVWTTNLHLEISFPWDRFTIAMMLGTSLILMGLIALITWRQWQMILLVSLLAGFGAGWHFQIALSIIRDWQLQKDLFWQLAWRAPGLEPGTAVMVSELPFTYNSAYSLTAPLNWMYAPQNSTLEMQYLMYDASLYFNPADLQSTTGKIEIPIDVENRMLYFRGSTSKTIYMMFKPSECLKIVDPAIHGSLPDKPPLFRELLALSNLSLVDAEPSAPAAPPFYFFGPEPKPSWCYYYEKADLARQLGNWEEIVEIGEQVFRDKSASTPREYAELIPFILGYGHMGEWDKAYRLTAQAHHADSKLKLILCQTWMTLRQEADQKAQSQPYFYKLNQELQCEHK